MTRLRESPCESMASRRGSLREPTVWFAERFTTEVDLAAGKLAGASDPVSHIPDQHRAEGPQTVSCAVITVSDTRTLQSDKGGQTLIEQLQDAGHRVVFREIIPDQPEAMRSRLIELRDRDDVAAILMTGGTGISRRDQTYETVSHLLTKPLPGYGELFRMRSYEQIGSAAMLSRATGGLLDRTVVLTMPGSPAAVRLAMQEIILPELGHLVREARR